MRNRYHSIVSAASALILSSLLFLNCGGKSEVKEVEVEKEDSFQSFQLDLKGESIPLSDLIDKIEITRLEETQESLLGYVRQIYFHEGKMIFPSGNEGNVYVYSSKGEFIRRINRKGEGPEEYGIWNDIWVEDGLIGIYTHQRHIKRYDIEGNFVSTDRMLQGATHLHPYQSGYALDMNYNFTSDTLKYALTILDDQMNVDKTYLPFENFPGFGLSSSNRTVFPNGEDLLYFPMMNDTVYRIESDSVVPYIHYDFKEDWYFQPGVEVSDAVFTEPEKKGQVWLVNNTIGEKYIYLSGSIGMGDSRIFLIDRDTKESVRIDFETPSTEEYQLSSIAWQGDEFLASLQSSQLEELLGQLEESQYSFTAGSTLEEIESSENPVLIRIRIKKSKDW